MGSGPRSSSIRCGSSRTTPSTRPIAAHRAVSRGKTKEDYLKSQRVWAVVCVVIGVIALAAATYYNLVIRPTMGE